MAICQLYGKWLDQTLNLPLTHHKKYHLYLKKIYFKIFFFYQISPLAIARSSYFIEWVLFIKSLRESETMSIFIWFKNIYFLCSFLMVHIQNSMQYCLRSSLNLDDASIAIFICDILEHVSYDNDIIYHNVWYFILFTTSRQHRGLCFSMST